MSTNKTPDRGLSHEDARLDALMKAARPTADAAREAALLERILAAAEKTPRVVAGTNEAPRVVTDSAAIPAVSRNTQPDVVDLATARAAARRPRRDVWAAGGLLAASLVAGLMLGQLPYASETMTRIEQATGLSIASPTYEIARAIASIELDEDEL